MNILVIEDLKALYTGHNMRMTRLISMCEKLLLALDEEGVPEVLILRYALQMCKIVQEDIEILGILHALFYLN